MIRTDDLFLGGFALTRGGELLAVDVRGTNGRRVAIFSIAGPGVDEAEAEYYRGETAVDLQRLKREVRWLKDRGFDAIREEERGGEHAGHDGRDRSHQGGEGSLRGRR